MNVASLRVSSAVVNGIRVEFIERGAGKPVLFLHPGIGISPSAPVLDALARGARLLAPTHPGFGASGGACCGISFFSASATLSVTSADGST